MDKSKYVCALKHILWNSSRAEGYVSFYKQPSSLLNYIHSSQDDHIQPKGDGSKNEVVLLHHTCPLLLSCALYEVANVNGMAYESAFLRTVVAKYEVRDYTITYKSNEFYIEIDCQVWSQIERRIIPECIKYLLAAKNISGNSHLVLIQNIDCLSESTLVILKSVIVDNLHHAKFICSLRTHRYTRRIFDTCATILHCDYCVEALVSQVLLRTRPDLDIVAPFLAKQFNKDLSLLVATLHAPRPMIYIPHIDSYIHEQLKQLYGSSHWDAYKHVTHLVCDLMSCFIGIDQIWPLVVDFVKKHRPDKVCDTLQVLADTQVDLVKSNKIVFPFEALFMKLYTLLHEMEVT